jgi:hypothetical protein
MIAAADRARRGGVKFAFGTDSGVAPARMHEFAPVKAGFTPLDAIRTATVWEPTTTACQLDQVAGAGPNDRHRCVQGRFYEDHEKKRITFIMKSGRFPAA